MKYFTRLTPSGWNVVKQDGTIISRHETYDAAVEFTNDLEAIDRQARTANQIDEALYRIFQIPVTIGLCYVVLGILFHILAHGFNAPDPADASWLILSTGGLVLILMTYGAIVWLINRSGQASPDN